MKLHFKIKHRVTLYTILLVATMASVLVSLGYHEISHTLYQQMLNEQSSRMRVAWILIQQEGPVELRKGKLYAGQTLLNGNSAIVDQITALVGGTATIFQGEIRIATNVRLPDGTRAIGTRLAQDKVKETLFKSHQNYRGQTLILGEPYVSAYDLIRDSQNKVVGILQVGAWKSAYDQTLSNILKRSLIVALLGILFIGFIVYGALHHLTHHLQEIAAKSKMLLESTGEGIYGVDLLGRCTFMNHTAAELLGDTVDSFLGKVIRPTLHSGATHDPLTENKLYSAFATENIRRNDEVFWRKNSTSFPVRYHSSPMNQNGVSQGAVVVFNDITSRKQTEAEIRETLRKVGNNPHLHRRRASDVA